MTGETKRASRSEERTKDKRGRESRRSNSASSGDAPRHRNACSKDKRNRSRRNRSSSGSGSSASTRGSRRRDDNSMKPKIDGWARMDNRNNGIRHQDNGNGRGGGFRKRRHSPGNWPRDQFDKRRGIGGGGRGGGFQRFDNRNERFRNNSFNRGGFRDRNWSNRGGSGGGGGPNRGYNDRNRERDRFQDRNDRIPRNRSAHDDSVEGKKEQSWSLESPEKEVKTQKIDDESPERRSKSPSKKKKLRRRSSSSSSVSSTSSTSSSSSSSSSSSTTSSSSSSSSSDGDKKRKRKKKKRLSKKAKKAEKKRKEKKRKLKRKQRKKLRKAAKDKKKRGDEDTDVEKKKEQPKDRLMKDLSNEIAEKAKSMAPMTKEEWEKRQSVVRKVYDEETGRHRLVKGDGEILEEIVPRDRHREINRQATRADGEYYQSRLRTNK